MEQNNKFVIQVDTREQIGKNNHVLAYFNVKGVKTIRSKMVVGDYCNYYKPNVVCDRKMSVYELVNDVCQQHERFKNELKLAQELGVKLYIVVEQCNWTSINYLKYWKSKVWLYGKNKGKPITQMKGETLMKILLTMQERYGCKFIFCKKEDSGRVIYEILKGTYKDL